jgi:hypothetical protein
MELTGSHRSLIFAITPDPLRSPAVACKPVVKSDGCKILFRCDQLAVMYETSWRVGDQIYNAPSTYVSYRQQLMDGFHLTCWWELVSLGIGHLAGREEVGSWYATFLKPMLLSMQWDDGCDIL